MNSIYKYIIAAGVVAMATTSCRRELLTPIPQTTVPDVASLSTPSRISGQLLSLYGSMKNGNYYGGRFVISGDIKGEDFINQTSNLITDSDVWALNPTNSTTNIVNIWAQIYTTINRCNLFIDGMTESGSTVVSAAVAANYIGEAKAIRAISYFGLLQFYARPYADGNGAKPGVPLRLTGIKGVGQSDLARSSVAEVYAQIIKDLNEAETGIPSSYTGATAAYDNTTRVHRNTVIAFKTRVYLAMQKYGDVITEANKMVSPAAPFTATAGIANALQAYIANVFASPYTTTEFILSMPMTNTAGDFPGIQNQLGYYYSPTTANGGVGNGEFALNEAGILADPSWSATDARRTNFVVKSGTGSAARTWLTKYKTGGNYTDYVPVIRYAEVLLNLAEARVRSTSSVDAQAISLLNAVRRRSDPGTTFTAANFASSVDLANAILRERRIEFLGEGLRNNDLMRLLQTIPAKGTAQAKLPSDVGYIWPISPAELSLNKLAVDN